MVEAGDISTLLDVVILNAEYSFELSYLLSYQKLSLSPVSSKYLVDQYIYSDIH